MNKLVDRIEERKALSRIRVKYGGVPANDDRDAPEWWVRLIGELDALCAACGNDPGVLRDAQALLEEKERIAAWKARSSESSGSAL